MKQILYVTPKMDLDFIKSKTYLIFPSVFSFHVQINELNWLIKYSGFDLKFFANAQTYSSLFTLFIFHLTQTLFTSTEENNIYYFAIRQRSVLHSCGFIKKLTEEHEKDIRDWSWTDTVYVRMAALLSF